MLLLKLVYRIFNLLPLGVSLFIGKIIGLFFYLSPRKKKVAFINLKQAFPQKDLAWIRCILKRSFFSFGKSIVELFLVEKLYKYVHLNSKEKLSSSQILVGIHEGSWELYNAYFGKKFGLVIFAERQKNIHWDRFLNTLRRKRGLEVCFSLKELIRYLRKNRWIGMVADHGAEKNAPFLSFFGQLVPTPSGAAFFAKKFNKKIFPAFGYRKGKNHYIIIDHPIECKDLEDKVILSRLNRIFENYISCYPWEYMWWYKRFKRKKNLSLLILHDGKAGHLKQSLAFLELFKDIGYKITYTVMKVEYKNTFSIPFLELMALFSSSRCLGCARCLRLFLTEKMYHDLVKNFFDIVISTGRICAPLNLIYANSIGAKSCVILKPNLPLKKFTLAIVPEHDKVKGKNVINIKGSIVTSQLNPEKIEEGIRFFQLSSHKKVSIFIGGPLTNHEEFKNNLNLFFKRLRNYLTDSGYRILVTTSRRTPPFAEEIISSALDGFDNVEASVFVSKKNWDFVVPTFLSVSDIVFVSGDSISMLSESLYQQKTTVAVILERLPKKHFEFIKDLEEKFLTVIGPPYDNFSFLTPKISLKEYNLKRLKEAVGRLL